MKVLLLLPVLFFALTATAQTSIDELKQKAEAGDPVAQVQLGLAYEHGDHVTQDVGAAAKWYKLAADKGNPAAQNNLGVMYRMGENFDENKETAVEWFRKSAKQGYGPALFNMGAAYYNGDGVQADTKTAYAYFYLASEAGDASGKDAFERTKTQLVGIVSERYLYALVAEVYGASGLGPDVQKQIYWLEKGEHYVPIGQIYYAGKGVPVDYEKARSWFQKAIDAHDPGTTPVAQAYLGVMYYEGQGVKQDYSASFPLLKKAACGLVHEAAPYVAHSYAAGLGTEKDDEKAYLWYAYAAGIGNRKAFDNVSDIEQRLGKKKVESMKKKMNKANGYPNWQDVCQ